MTSPNVQESGRKGEATARKRRKRRRGSVSDYALSAAMILALSGFWSVWLSPSSVKGRVDPDTGIRLRYLSPAERSVWIETGRWPSILMSVPTRAGFSGDVLVDRILTEPKLDKPEIEILFLERESGGGGRAIPRAEPPLPRAIFQDDTRPSPQMPVPPPRVTLPATVRPDFEIAFSRGLDRSDFLRTPLPEALNRGPSGWWVARFWVEVGPGGDVDLALLEESTGQTDLDRALVRTLHQWQGKDTGRAVSGEIRIGSVGPAQLPGDEE